MLRILSNIIFKNVKVIGNIYIYINIYKHIYIYIVVIFWKKKKLLKKWKLAAILIIQSPIKLKLVYSYKMIYIKWLFRGRSVLRLITT